MTRNYHREILAAHKAGDVESLSEIALELASMVEAAIEIERHEVARKALRAEQKRAERARKAEGVARRRATIATSPDTEGELSTKILTTKAKASRRAETPLPGVSWVTRLHGVWTSLAGAAQVGQVGKSLKQYVDTRGEPAVERGMRLFIATKQARGETLNFGWFANDAVQWIDKAGKLDIVDGEMSPELELLTRPNGVGRR